jgi:hypothetical protein
VNEDISAGVILALAVVCALYLTFWLGSELTEQRVYKQCDKAGSFFIERKGNLEQYTCNLVNP